MRTGLKPTLAVAALAAGVAVAGCGGDDEGDGGPASIVPAKAPAYVEVLVQPEGEAADDAAAALGKVSGSDDPGGDLVRLLESGSSGFDFEDDIEPWLGERLGAYPSSLNRDADATLVIETTDADEALESVREREDATGGEQEYEGHTFELDAEGDAFGIVEDFLVTGPPAGFKQVVDVAEGGEGLADSGEFEDSLSELPDDRLLTIFAVPNFFVGGLASQELDQEERRLLQRALGDAGEEPVLGSLTASAEAVTLEFSAAGDGVETEQSKLLRQVPSESWLALAFADIGGAVERALGQVEAAGIPALNEETIVRELSSRTGIDLQREVIGALGDAALFITGTTERTLGGALVIRTEDAAASAELLGKLEDLISTEAGDEVEIEQLASTDGSEQGFQIITSDQGTTQPITVIQRDDRIIAGYGGEAVNQALSAQGVEPLSKSATFRSAEEAAGELGLDAFVSIAPILELAESAGAAEASAYQSAKPYLDALSFLAIGSGSEGDRGVVRFTLGLE